MPFAVLINENSGTVLRLGQAILSEQLIEALGSNLRFIRFLGSSEFSGALKTIPKTENIMVGGGDGTICTAASILKPRQIPFGILPLGTMNLFAKDLSLEQNPIKLAGLYNKFKAINVDTASVNGNIFLCNAMIGIALEVAEEREENRNNETLIKWITLCRRGLKKLSYGYGRSIFITYDGITEHKKIKAAIIANNEYCTESSIGTFKKKSLCAGKLAVYTVNPEGTVESVTLLAKLALGSWSDAKGIEFFDTKSLTLTSNRGKSSVLLDGEVHRLKNPLSFISEPASLSLLVPDI